MASTIYATMRQRRNTYAFFQQDNTLLEDGQLGIINSGQYKNCFKIGDGVTRWNTLPWVTDYQLLFNKPQVNGVNLSGNVSLSQLGVASAAGLTTEAQTRQQADTALTQALATEKTERQSADTTEAQARQQADAALTQALATEKMERQSADTTEAQVRQQADAALTQALATEKMERQSADTTEAQARQQADAALTQALATEKTERQSADEALAPIESPHFTGVPTTPEPDYTVPDQIATVQDSIFMRDLILYTILDEARLTQNHNSFFGNTIRITCNGRIRGIYVD